MQRESVDLGSISGYFRSIPASMMTEYPEESGSERRLAAIMFTDMVGYSALSQQDETRALQLLEEHRALVRPLLLAHRGREIKTIGDAFLVEFDSALDAVRCAVGIQRALRDRNASTPADRRILLRIGLHVGDVVHRDHDVYGDGVNIASRIEPLAEPGGVCLSEDVARQVQNKIDHPLLPLGERDLKNINLPLRLYAIQMPWASGRRRTSHWRVIPWRRAAASLLALAFIGWFAWSIRGWFSDPAPIRRIAVLPLEDLSPGSGDAYFADGITEELISSLARISGLEVIARTSAMHYRQAGMDVGIVSRELNAGTVLGGSVRRAGERARILVRLIDVSSGKVVWTEEYDREMRDVLAVQNDIALRVASALRVQLLDVERADLQQRGTTSAEAYRLVLLGRHHLHRRTSEDVQKALVYFLGATDADPDYADTWIGLAECNILFAGAGYGNVPRDRAVDDARTAIMRALTLQPRSADALAVLGYLQYRLDWNWSAADTCFAAAVTLKPGDARIHEWRGLFLSLRGDTRGGVIEMERAFALDPRSPSVGTGLGRVLAFDRQFDRAIRQLESVVREYPEYAEGQFALGLAYGYIGRIQESISTLERATRLSGRRPVILADLGHAYAIAGRRNDALGVLAEIDSLARTQTVSPWVRSMVYFGLGENDKAFDLMEASLAQREGLLVYIKAEPMLPSVRNHPRFQAIIRAIGLEP